MKSVLLFFTVIFIGHTAIAQKISSSKAIEFANKLYEIEILSEEGKNQLIENINSKEADLYEWSTLSDSKYQRNDSLTHGSILGFCEKAFNQEYAYRMDDSEAREQSKKITDEAIFKLMREMSFTTAFLQKIVDSQKDVKEKIQAQMNKGKGRSIEMAIPNEDTFPKNFSYYSTNAFNNGKKWFEEYQPLIKPTRSVFGKTRIRTLTDIFKIGLIDKRLYEETLAKLLSFELFLESQMFSFITERIQYYGNYEINKKRELKKLKALLESDIISETNRKKLVESYKPFELKGEFEFIPYCNNALVFDLKQYSLNPKEYFPLIFKDIKKILPEFDFQNLKIEIKEEEDRMGTTQRLFFSFESKEKIYSNTTYHKFIRKEKSPNDKPDTLAIVGEGFQLGINNFLKDINSPKRLYFVKNIVEGTGFSLEKDFGLMAMTETQRKAWGEVYAVFSRENHDNTFNTEGVKKIIKEYETIGLFNHLTSAQIDSSKMQILSKEINSYGDILLAFPSIVVYFDWETGNLENPYQELTEQFAKVSKGLFNPSEVVDDFLKNEKNDKTPYGFTFKVKRYEKELKMTGDWLDPDFMELIKTALKEQMPEIAIYSYLSDGQASGYIILNKKQYEFLLKHHSTFFEKK